jgi:hypothetical protein
MNDLGLISVLPIPFYVAIVLLTVGFCLELSHRPVRVAVMLPYILVLILVLYGTPGLVEHTPRYASTWKHLGVTDYIVRHGAVNPHIDAYFNWPGFFAFAAFVTELAGVSSLTGELTWVFVFLNVRFLAPLLMLFRASTRDARLVWLGVWLFYLSNWVGQDYFAPQALDFFLYLVIIAVLVRWFPRTSTDAGVWGQALLRAPRWARGALGRLLDFDDHDAPGQPWQRVGLIAAVIAMSAAMVPSHQLTPFAAVFAMALMVVFDRITPRTLPILLLVLTLAWMGFMAVPYMRGRLDYHLTQVGQVDSNATRGVAGRFRGSQEHRLVLRVRLAVSLAVAALAAGGALRRLLRGRHDLTLLLAGAAPAMLLGAQAYGGEIVLRVYFFALPVMAFFAASFFYTETEQRAWMRWPMAIIVGVTSVALCTGFLIARYGNERMDYSTPQELAAVDQLFDIAPVGSVLYATGESQSWKAHDYELYPRQHLNKVYVLNGDVNGAADAMTPKQNRAAYLLLTRSTNAQAEMFQGVPPGVMAQFEQLLRESDRFEIVYSNRDATIFKLVQPAAQTGRAP